MSYAGSIMLLSVFAAVVSTCGACEPRPPFYACPKVDCAPIVDGKLDDAAWKAAPEVTLVLSCTGEQATKTTRARMCWDDECFYIAFDCADPDVFATMVKRDDYIWREEVVEVFVCPDCDLRHYYEINVNPRNTVFDAYIVNDGGSLGSGTDFGWTCEGLKTAVCVDGTIDNRGDTDRGWTVEYAIPFAALKRCTPKAGERWRLNLYRIDQYPEPVEYQAWSPTLTPKPAFHVPKRFGTVFFTESS